MGSLTGWHPAPFLTMMGLGLPGFKSRHTCFSLLHTYNPNLSGGNFSLGWLTGRHPSPFPVLRPPAWIWLTAPHQYLIRPLSHNQCGINWLSVKFWDKGVRQKLFLIFAIRDACTSYKCTALWCSVCRAPPKRLFHWWCLRSSNSPIQFAQWTPFNYLLLNRAQSSHHPGPIIRPHYQCVIITCAPLFIGPPCSP